MSNGQIFNEIDVTQLNAKEYINAVMKDVTDKYCHMNEFCSAVREFLPSIEPYVEKNPIIIDKNILSIILIPERIISFRVPWQDDKGIWRANIGIRVQYNSALGPYKGGIRFDPSVNESIIRFLGFEQIFKNALTGLPIGGGKGGSNFSPKGKSEAEVMRFCQSYMTELQKYVGPDIDVPAGDMGVHAREIGYLYGQYKRLNGSQPGVITGKPPLLGGIKGRPEATGFGLIYMVNNFFKDIDTHLKDKRVVISGIGNVGSRAILKAQEFGANVIAISDSSGYLTDEKGIDVAYIQEIAEDGNMTLADYAACHESATHYPGESVYDAKLEYDVALPCATQNEINKERAENMVHCGVRLVAEGANMPSNEDAIDVYKANGIYYIPGKAANAGGVAVSALEMSQNSTRVPWTFEQTDAELKIIMKNIYDLISETAEEYAEKYDFQAGANIAGFIKVAEAMIAQGLV